MTAGRRSWKGWVVRVAALLFAVQGALLAFSQGASADALRVDQFGNVLCLASADTHGSVAGETGGKHSDLMDCCSLGCPMFASLVAPPQGTATPLARRMPAEAAAFVSYADRLSSVEDSPRRTRGPPEAV